MDLLEESQSLMPGRGRGHWSLGEAQSPEEIDRTFDEVGSMIKAFERLEPRFLDQLERLSGLKGWQSHGAAMKHGRVFVPFGTFLGIDFILNHKEGDVVHMLRVRFDVSPKHEDGVREWGLHATATVRNVPRGHGSDTKVEFRKMGHWGAREADTWKDPRKALAPLRGFLRKAQSLQPKGESLLRRSNLEESKTPVFNPYGMGMWVIRVEDYLHKVTGKKWTWKKPIMSMEGGKRLQYKWVGRKKRGAIVPPMFLSIVEYKPGADLFDVETQYFDGDHVVASKTHHGFQTDQAVNPEALFGWVRTKWNRKTGMKAESKMEARDVKKMAIDWWTSMPPSDQKRVAKKLGLSASDARKWGAGDRLDVIKYYRKTMESIEESKGDPRLLKKAAELGKKSIEAGYKAASHDPEMQRFLKKHTSNEVGSSLPYLKAYAKARQTAARMRAREKLKKKGHPITKKESIDEGKAPFRDIEKGLVDYLKTHKTVTVAELNYAFQGGPSKIEKLLAKMVKDGTLKKRKKQVGGAKTPKMSAYIYSLAESAPVEEAVFTARGVEYSATRAFRGMEKKGVDLEELADGLGMRLSGVARKLPHGSSPSRARVVLKKVLKDLGAYVMPHGEDLIDLMVLAAAKSGNPIEFFGRLELEVLKAERSGASVESLGAAFGRAYKRVSGKQESAPGPFAVSDNPPTLADQIEAIRDQIRAPSWTYPTWALPKVQLDEALVHPEPGEFAVVMLRGGRESKIKSFDDVHDALALARKWEQKMAASKIYKSKDAIYVLHGPHRQMISSKNVGQARREMKKRG